MGPDPDKPVLGRSGSFGAVSPNGELTLETGRGILSIYKKLYGFDSNIGHPHCSVFGFQVSGVRREKGKSCAKHPHRINLNPARGGKT